MPDPPHIEQPARRAVPPSGSCDVFLISMPWNELPIPSLQLGILQAVLEDAGIPTTTAHFNVSFADRLAQTMQFSMDEYTKITRSWRLGVGEWLFLVPPLRESCATEEGRYLRYLAQNGFTPEGLDRLLQVRRAVPSFLEACGQQVLAQAPRVVGFSLSLSQTVPSLALSKWIKMASPSTLVVFGGSSCQEPMGRALHAAYPWLDILVSGEAETILPLLVRRLLRKESPPSFNGVYLRGIECDNQPTVRPQVRMAEVPLPNFVEYFQRLSSTSIGEAILPKVWLPIQNSRGCWWGEREHCTFCGINGRDMQFRARSDAEAFDLLMDLARRYERLHFVVVDSIADMRYFGGLLPRLRDAGANVDLFLETKSNLGREHLRLMRDAGVRGFQPGLETLDTSLLKRIRKGVTALQNIRLLKWSLEYQVWPAWNMLYGFPGEPKEAYARMLAVIPALAHLPPPGTVGKVRVDRFSPYHTAPRQYGIRSLRPYPFYSFLHDVPPDMLEALAYHFDFEYDDGCDPESYVCQWRESIRRWQETYGRSSLLLRRGPTFIRLEDRRVNPARITTFRGLESRVFLACDAGATLEGVWRTLTDEERAGVSPGRIEAFLKECVAERLMYVEDGRYLALAVGVSVG